jgi:nitrite reductase/ring-hydroxylating ferredoxin subunit
MAKLVKIVETKDLTRGQATAFDVEGQKIALFNVEGTFYAVGDSALIAAGRSRKDR